MGEIWEQWQFLPRTGKSKDYPWEGQPLPGAAEVPESGQESSPHLLTLGPEVREEG